MGPRIEIALNRLSALKSRAINPMLGEGGPRSRAGRPIWVKAVLILLLASTLIVLLYYQATLTNINQALKQSGRNGTGLLKKPALSLPGRPGADP